MTGKTQVIIDRLNPGDPQALEKCIVFLRGIGIKTTTKRLEQDSFLPGISIEEGCIIFDPEALIYPGDILHEAGHIAVTPAALRSGLNEKLIKESEHREAEEMMAIAWSYAACIHLGLDPCFVFHEGGYKGGGGGIANNFAEKNYIGLPMLQWTGMAADENKAARDQVPAYPAMIKWLRD